MLVSLLKMKPLPGRRKALQRWLPIRQAKKSYNSAGLIQGITIPQSEPRSTASGLIFTRLPGECSTECAVIFR